MSNVTLDHLTRERLRLLVSEQRRQKLGLQMVAHHANADGTCEQCEGPIVASTQKKRYCSLTCRRSAQKKRYRHANRERVNEQYREYRKKRRQKLCECGCGSPTPLAKRNDPRRGQVTGQPIRFIQGHNTGTRRKGLQWGARESTRRRDPK